MEIVKETQSATLKATTTLESVDLGDDLSVYRVTRQMEPEASLPGLLKQAASRYVDEGFTSTEGLRKHAAGDDSFPQAAQGIHVVPRNFLKLIARHGFSEGYEMAQKDDKGFEEGRPFTALVESGVSVDRVLRIDYSSHMVFDRSGNVMPAGIHFEYIKACMDNAHYDLLRALEILKQNERVHFLSRRERLTDEPEILAIEHYNASSLRNRYLAFWFEPTVEEQRALWEKQKAYGTKYPSTEEYRAMFDLDILGLRAGGAAYYDDFHKSREYDDAYKHLLDDDD